LAQPLFDPNTLPIQDWVGEPALAPERLHPDWLRQRFANPPAWVCEPSAEPRFNQRPITKAAVLMPIVLQADGLHLLLTQRTAHLNDHAGQVSFPGGRWEEGDASIIETALRETEEEVGLSRRHVDILGVLPEYLTGTGYLVTPVVALVQPPFELQADTFEVAEIFQVPLAFLMDGSNHQRRQFEMPGGLGTRTFYAMPYRDFFIWGATAGMLRNLFHFLRA
jgi:8-oxo-dGTP pyrophosphatase MutT (NUDIX family)